MAGGNDLRKLDAAGALGKKPLAGALLVCLIVLVAASCHQVAAATSLLPMGRLPGQDVQYSDTVILLSIFAMATGATLSLMAPRRGLGRALAAALAPAASAFVTARFYTFDPYYLAALRRHSEDGTVSEAWIFGLLLVALSTGPAAWFRPASGPLLTSLVLLACLMTALAEGAGH
jgi:hypothetical protein